VNILFVCGGTAGHINPALAIAEEFLKTMPDTEIKFIGAGREMEKKLIPKAGYELFNIRMSGLKRGLSPNDMLHNAKMLRYLATAGREAAEIIDHFNPNAVIGTGGYICYPVLKKAAMIGIPSFIHESNAMPGLTTKLLSSIVDRVLVSFPGVENNYRRPERVVFTGTPILGGFEDRSAVEHLRDVNEKGFIVSFWGSLGAEGMNEKIAEFIKLNIDSGEFRHVHATGRAGGVAEMSSRLKRIGVSGELPPDVEIIEYIDDMDSVMADADIVLCRAGGSTIAELTAMGKPAILVPSPYVSNNEQEKNAEQLQKAGGAIVIDENKCTGRMLFDTVSSILRDGSRLKRMADAQRLLGVHNAAERIFGIVTSLINGER